MSEEILAQILETQQAILGHLSALQRVISAERGARRSGPDPADERLCAQIVTSALPSSGYTAREMWRHARHENPALAQALIECDLLSIRELGHWFKRLALHPIPNYSVRSDEIRREGRVWVVRVVNDETRAARESVA